MNRSIDQRGIDNELDWEDPKDIIYRNNLKNSADKIRRTLSNVQNNPSMSSKRWIWELMQNAKDVPNKKFGQISIQVVLYEDKLLFKHNGDPFTLHDIISLIQQVSSKNSVNDDEQVTGKFGSGFIVTHLLSNIIDVSGFVKHSGVYRKFDLQLDRSGESSEDMLPKIEEALNHILDIEDSSKFPVVSGYNLDRKESDHDTVFTYNLTSEEKKRAAKNGIKDLINTLPLTLTNIPKIKRVEIVNKITGIKDIYECNKINEENDFETYKVGVHNLNLDKETLFFIKYKLNEVSVTAEIKDSSGYELVPYIKDSPRVFRDFPLIGSDKFYFPFYLNGNLFNPTEDRAGLHLHSTENPEAAKNREYIEDAFFASRNLIEYLIQKKAKNRFVMAQSRLPDEKWDEEFSKNWIHNLQSKHRSFLLDQYLVETDGQYNLKLKNAIIPNFGDSNGSKTRFYELVRELKGKERVPKRDQIIDWIRYTGPKEEMDSWGHPVRYELDDLIDDIVESKTIDNLSKIIEAEGNVVHWLNRVYKFIVDENKSEVFARVPIIPNQNGEFKNLNDLYLEDNLEPIPDEFLDQIAIISDDWRQFLIHREISLKDQNIDKRGLSDLSKEINKCINEDKHFLEKENALEILVNILRNYQEDISLSDFRAHIFQFGKDLLKFKDDIIRVDTTLGFRFEVSLRHIIELIHKKLESIGTISGLSEHLTLNEKSTIEWLDTYLYTIHNKSDFKSEIEDSVIIPNHYGEFCEEQDLHNYGTEETPLDNNLLEILKELDPSEDWRQRIIHPDITIPIEKTIKFEELGSKIQELVSEVIKSDAVEPDGEHLDKVKDQLFDVIDWIEKNDQLAERYLSQVRNKSSEIFFKLTVSNSSLGIDDIKLLGDQESKALLSKISRSKIPKNKINDLLDVIEEIGSTDKLLHQAQRIRDEVQNMKFLLRVGEKVEEAVKDAISTDLIDVTSSRQGWGDFDLVFQNEHNDRSYFLELKSYAASSDRDFRFAPSQAKRAMENQTNYAISFIERPNENDITKEYVRSNLLFCKQVGNVMKQGYTDYLLFNEIKTRVNTTSKLRAILLEKERIEASKDQLLFKSKSFDDLIADIKNYLL